MDYAAIAGVMRVLIVLIVIIIMIIIAAVSSAMEMTAITIGKLYVAFVITLAGCHVTPNNGRSRSCSFTMLRPLLP